MQLTKNIWRRTACALLALLVFSCSPAGKDGGEVNVLQLIPTGTTDVAIMTLAAPPQFFELSQKLQDAMRKDPQWFMSYRASVPPGEPLPYHPKLGMTEAEYHEYSLLMSQLAMQRSGKAVLDVQQRDSLFSISTADSAIAGLNGIVIDLGHDQVTTPFGVTHQRTEIDNEGVDAPTGPWRGVQWGLQRRDIASGESVSVKFAIGKLEESGQGILYYNATRIDSSGNGNRILYVLYYDLDGSFPPDR
jgi:hypothetical protein